MQPDLAQQERRDRRTFLQTTSSARPGLIFGLIRSVFPLLFLILSWQAHAQIPITGLSDKANYTETVTYTVTRQAGYDYLALLDGDPSNVGAAVTVTSIGYHELALWRTNLSSQQVTNAVLRFNILASERGSTETGLPRWVPFPPIPSSFEETTSGGLRVIVPARFPAGMDMPIVIWVEDKAGQTLRVNGSVRSAPAGDIIIRRGVGSALIPLVPADSPEPVQLISTFNQLQSTNAVAIETNTVWSPVSGSLSGDVTWAEDARIDVTSTLSIPAGVSVSVGAGAVVRIAPGASVLLAGRLSVTGTPEKPVIFTPVSSTSPWGGFYLTNGTSRLEATHAIFTGSGADPNAVPASHRHEQCLFFLDNHAALHLTNAAAVWLKGQFGHAVDRGQPWNDISIVRTLIQRCTTGGEWNGSAITFAQSALIEVPYETDQFNDGDEDGIYFTTGLYSVSDSLIGWTRDDGIDAGSGGGSSVTVTNTWVESIYHEAFAYSGGDRRTTNYHTVSLNCGQGIECGWSSTAESPLDFADDILVLGNAVGARFGDNYDWTYSGFLRVTNSMILYNQRDVWGLNWQDWTYRTNAMDIQGNFLSVANPLHPNNAVWTPDIDGQRLAAFSLTPGAAVGIGLALYGAQFGFSAVTNPMPVGLSSFTTNIVEVGYVYESATEEISSGNLVFQPGETLKWIAGPKTLPDSGEVVRLRLQTPVHADLTGKTNAWFIKGNAGSVLTLVPSGAVWSYFDTGADLGSAWRELDFDANSWPSGRAELGYGDSKDGRPETTVISYGTNSSDKHITYYFRHEFQVDNPLEVGLLGVRLLRDDGGIVYLNGEEVFRSNIAPGPVDYLTKASLASDDGTTFYETNAPSSLLRPGINLVAVEIHQESGTSSDVSFNLELLGQPGLRLRMTPFRDTWLITWDDSAAGLEVADSLVGPWSPFPGASPTPMPVTAGSRFFRLHKSL